MSLAPKVRAGVTWVGIAQIGGRLWSVAVIAVLARLLAPKDFGLIGTMVTIIGFLSLISEMGLTEAIVRKPVLSETDLRQSVTAAVTTAFVLALAVIVSAPAIATFFHEPKLTQFLRIVALLLPVSAMGQVPHALLQRRLEFKKIAAIEMSASLISGVIAVAAAFRGLGAVALLIQTLASGILLSVGRVTAAKWRIRPDWRLDRNSTLWRFGATVVGISLINYAASNIDNALVARRLGTAELGIYLLCYNLVLLPASYGGAVVGRVVYPALASIQTERERFRSAYLRSIRVMSLLTIPTLFGLAAIAGPFISVVYGPKWSGAVPILQVMAVVGICQAVNTSGMVFYALGRPNFLLFWGGGSLLIMTAGFYVGASRGILGVAVVYAILSPFIFVAPHFWANRLAGISGKSFVSALAAASICSMVMFVVVFGLSNTLLSQLTAPLQLMAAVLIGVIVYVGLLFALSLTTRPRRRFDDWVLGSADARLVREP